MITSWRLLVAAALTALTMTTLTAATAAAQTVMVRHAPPGETVETVLNATKVGSATVDASGTATVPLSLSSTGKTEIDANVFVDICDKLHRVIVVERNKLPDPQQPGCARRDISGLYWVRPVNTLVVDVAEGRPSLLLVKGSYNPERPRTWNTAPRGFVVYGGGTIGSFRDAISVSCGNVTNCKGDSTLAGFTAGGTVWLLPYLGADVAYVKPQDVKTSGSGSTYHFNSDLESQLLTIAGKVGAPIGPVRLYGQAGMAYHWTEEHGHRDDRRPDDHGRQRPADDPRRHAGLAAPDGRLGLVVRRRRRSVDRAVVRPLRGPELRVHHRFSQIGGEARIDDHAPVHRLRRARPHRPPLSEDRAGYCTLSNSMSNTSDE